MIKLTKTINDPSGIVSKLIFEDETAIAETVGYQYEDRRVVCLSVQSGCRIGCEFCGTGNRFIRNLTMEEMKTQLIDTLAVIGITDNVQVMTMSMGEPMDNWKEVKFFISWLQSYYPHVRCYISTVGLRKAWVLADFLDLAERNHNFGLQFSLHHHDDTIRRGKMGNYPSLLSTQELSSFGRLWTEWGKRRCYFNYICTGAEERDDAYMVSKLVSGMHLTCSVKCDTGGFIKADQQHAKRFAAMVIDTADFGADIDVSLFDPAGQDTIGGGCGQLLYVQERLKNR